MKDKALRKTHNQVAAKMLAAIENATPDRELVTRAFHMQMKALALEPRPVIFYPNLKAVRVLKLALRNSSTKTAAWDALSDAAWYDEKDRGVKDKRARD